MPAPATYISDDFNRSDAASLGADWSEISEGGSGLQIVSNALHCVRQTSPNRSSSGIAIHQTPVAAHSLSVAFDAQAGIANSGNIRLDIYARLSSASAVAGADYYRLAVNSQATGAALYRSNAGVETLLDSGLAIPLAKASMTTFEWRVLSKPGEVTHEIYVATVLTETVDDTDPERLTADIGYIAIGAFCHGILVPSVGDEHSIDVDDLVVSNLGFRMAGAAGNLHTVFRAFEVEDGVGTLHEIVESAFAVTNGAGPQHITRNGFTVTGAGPTHTVFNAFENDSNEGPEHSFYSAVRQTRGAGTLHRIGRSFTMNAGAGTLHRVANTVSSKYRLYRGEDAAPDFTASPWEEFNSLPHTTSGTLAAGHAYHFVLREVNAYGLESANEDAVVLTIDGSGNLTPVAPADPVEISVAPAEGGRVKVTAYYRYLADGAHAATKFLVYLSADGSDPDPATDTPTEVTFTARDGIAKLEWTSDPLT